MIHPLLHLIATQPHLLAEHIEAYAELAGDGLGRTASAIKWRLVLNVVALGSVAMAAVLGGVALMLWAVTPPAAVHAGWALIAAPMLPLLVGLACLLIASQQPEAIGFGDLKQQIAADLLMLREVSAA